MRTLTALHRPWLRFTEEKNNTPTTAPDLNYERGIFRTEIKYKKPPVANARSTVYWTPDVKK